MKIIIKNPELLSLTDFIEKIDREGAVVLLEGKREVLDSDKESLIAIGKLLAEKTTHIMFRSGNAEGADGFFAEGVASVNPDRLELIIPYATHRKGSNKFKSHALDEINMVMETNVVYQSKKNAAAKGLVEAYVKGANKRLAAKGAYLLRDTIKVTGTKSGIPHATFGIFYDDLRKPQTGGTGHTMKMCKENFVPFVDQKTWRKWLG